MTMHMALTLAFERATQTADELRARELVPSHKTLSASILCSMRAVSSARSRPWPELALRRRAWEHALSELRTISRAGARPSHYDYSNALWAGCGAGLGWEAAEEVMRIGTSGRLLAWLNSALLACRDI